MESSSPTTEQKPETASPGKFRVLIVDDERDVLQVVQDILHENGLDVVASSSPLEALQKAKRSKFDALVLDVSMPEMSGMLFHAKVRMFDAELAKRTVFISGYVSRDELREHLSAKPNFLEKPFKADQLMTYLRKLLPGEPRR